MEEEVHDAISRLSDEKKKSNGDMIADLVDLYEKGELLRTKVEAEQLSLLRSMKKMVSELHVSQEIELNVLNTMCEINGYENFVSLEEQKSFALSEAEKFVSDRNHREIIRQLEQAKANGTSE